MLLITIVLMLKLVLTDSVEILAIADKMLNVLLNLIVLFARVLRIMKAIQILLVALLDVEAILNVILINHVSIQIVSIHA